MKKIFSVIAVAMIAAMMFAGCNDTSTASSDTNAVTATASASTESGEEAIEGETVQAADYDKTFEGFIQYMTDAGYTKGEGTDLTASAIGAKQGKRYTITSGSSKIYIEYYEFEENASETSDLAKKTIENARKDGSFTLFDTTTSATQNTLAAVSDDGRFLMLYTDSSTNESNITAKNDAAELVKNFSK